MLKKIALGFVVVIALILGVAALQPAEYHVERSTVIQAPLEAVFPLVNDFHNWAGWSPWEKMDPAMKKSFTGPAAGVGSVYSWEGNGQVGEGSMTVTESSPNTSLKLRLEFKKPFEDTSAVQFSFKPEGAGTSVTWSMDGQKKFAAKVMCLFMSMDKMLGGQFETGLSALKGLAEARK